MPMTDQERGSLLVQKEKAGARVAQIQADLRSRAAGMQRFASALGNPGNVVFSNAPSPLGNLPPHLMGAPSFEWGQTSQVLDLTGIAQAIQDLRAAEADLSRLAQQLGQQ